MSSLNLIFGRLQKGKSTLAYHLARNSHKAVFIYDPTDVFDLPFICRSGEDMQETLEHFRDSTGPVVMVMRPEDPERDLAEFVLVALAYADCSVIVDEASFLQSPHYLHPALSKLIRKGPKQAKNRDFFLTQHRASDCNGLVFGMAHTYVFFETTLVRDLDRIAEQCGDQVAERVSKLGPRDWLSYDVGTKKFFVNNAPETWRENLDINAARSPRAEEEFPEIPSPAWTQ